MDYLIMKPPFQIKNFDEMSEMDAKKHFEWFLSEISNRHRMLEEAVNSFKPNIKVKLDYSKDSLINLWGWYIDNVQIVKKSENDYQNDLAISNLVTREFINEFEIATGWLSVAMDISIYFAECFIKNNEVLEWGLVTRPKSLACVNKPVIIGFKNDMKLDATNIVYVQTRKILKGIKYKEALYQLYNNWASLV